MQPQHRDNRTQKTIASFMVILAVVIVTVGVSALNHKKASVATTTPASTTATTTPSSTTQTSTTPSTTAGTYKDGTYSASSTYETPGGQEGISVNLTVQNGAVSNATVQNQSNNHESQAYQSSFVSAYKTYVVGKKLSDINVSGISGSSLTETGFSNALSQIISQARTS